MAARDPEQHPITSAGLRSAMARFPTAVTVVTAMADGRPSGLSANAVTSLSLEPPLMLACLDRGSRTLRAVERAGHYGVNLLGEGGEALARTFGRKVEMADKWRGVEWAEREGIPALADAIVFIGCETRDVIGGGDHVIVTGEVRSIEQRPGRPLLFENGTYRPIG